MPNALRRALLTNVVALLVAFPCGAAKADDGAWKATTDTDPHLPLTPQQQEMTLEKRSVECAECIGGGSYPSSAHLAANQTPQITSYYCGPAAVHEALGALGASLSQTAAAAELRTGADGTAWSGGGTSPSGYPVPDVLNAHQSRNYYVPQYVSSPTSAAIDRYENDLKADIFAVEAPLVGDAWETPTSDHHLVGHPTNRTIFHWFEIRGYQSSGGTTMYEDSVHNATTISWYAGVPAYSNIPSSWLVSIVAGRGYVW